VFTGDPAQPWAEAIAVRGNRIVAVGSTADLRATTPKLRLVDAGGRLLIPGINDAHTHPAATPPFTPMEGPSAIEHDPTLDEVIGRLQAAIAKAPPRGWD
jgi:predicted amidohydrolase YtcJ